MAKQSPAQYRQIFPLAQKDSYTSNDTVDFLISFQDDNLAVSSVAICGNCSVYQTGTTLPSTTQEVLIDPDAGYHSLFSDINTTFKNIGLVESFTNYPRYVKMHTQCNKYQNELGTQSDNAIEGKCATERIRLGYNQHSAVPFAVKPLVSVNKTSAPLSGNKMGVVRMRIRLAPDNEVIYGEDVTTASNYSITDLHLRYEVTGQQSSDEPVSMEVYNNARQVVETNNANLATFVAGLSDSVHMSFIKTATQQDVTANFLKCETPKGKPLGSSTASDNYGLERAVFSVNDLDTALVSFPLESRSEILWNYLRSFNAEPSRWCEMLSRQQNGGDAYGLGMPFGTLLDFSKQKFSVDLESEISEATSVFLFFRSMVQV